MEYAIELLAEGQSYRLPVPRVLHPLRVKNEGKNLVATNYRENWRAINVQRKKILDVVLFM